MVFDLPAGGRRLVQHVDGYKYTVVSGEVTFEDGHCRPASSNVGTFEPLSIAPHRAMASAITADT